MRLEELKDIKSKIQKIEYSLLPENIRKLLDPYKLQLPYLDLNKISYFEESKSSIGILIPIELPIEIQKFNELMSILKTKVFLLFRDKKPYIYFKSFDGDLWHI